MSYVVGPLAGLALGAVSALFAQGGISRRRVLGRVLRWGGAWRRQRIILLALSAAMGLYGAWLYGAVGRDLLGFQLLAGYLLAATVTDLRGRRIPDDMSLAYAALFLLFQLSYLFTDGPWQLLAQLLGSALGAGLGGLIFLALHLAKRDAVGLGDAKMLAVAGLMAGFPGILYLMVRAMVAICLYSVIQLLRRKLSRGAQVPFAPFLLLGALL